MNSLSWMMYLADVVGSVSTIGTMVAIGAGIGGLVATVLTAMKTDFDNIGRRAGEEQECLSNGWKAGKGFFVTSIIAACVCAPIPSKNTIYAIAASEMGESLINTPTAGKAVKALDAWLDRQIDGKDEKE